MFVTSGNGSGHSNGNSSWSVEQGRPTAGGGASYACGLSPELMRECPRNACVWAAAQNGQQPTYTIVGYALGNYPLVNIAKVREATAFRISGAVITTKIEEAGGFTDAVGPGIEYSLNHLGTKKFISFGSSNSPLAVTIVDYFRPDAATLPESENYLHPWMELKKPVYDEAFKVAEELGLDLGSKAGVAALYKLTALELTRERGLRTKAIVRGYELGGKHKKDVQIASIYHDAVRNIVYPLDMSASLMDLFQQSETITGIVVAPPPQHKAKCMCFVCCDSRDNMGDSFSKNEGDVLTNASIAAFFPPHTVLVNGETHPSLRDLRRALKEGMRDFKVRGHSDCGGIRADVKMVRDNTSIGTLLDPWLEQAAPVIREVLTFAEGTGMSDDMLHELVDKRVKTWSANNMADYLEFLGHQDATVGAYFRDLMTRSIEVLPLTDTIQDTYDKMLHPEKIEYYSLATVFDPKEIAHLCPKKDKFNGTNPMLEELFVMSAAYAKPKHKRAETRLQPVREQVQVGDLTPQMA